MSLGVSSCLFRMVLLGFVEGEIVGFFRISLEAKGKW